MIGHWITEWRCEHSKRCLVRSSIVSSFFFCSAKKPSKMERKRQRKLDSLARRRYHDEGTHEGRSLPAQPGYVRQRSTPSSSNRVSVRRLSPIPDGRERFGSLGHEMLMVEDSNSSSYGYRGRHLRSKSELYERDHHRRDHDHTYENYDEGYWRNPTGHSAEQKPDRRVRGLRSRSDYYSHRSQRSFPTPSGSHHRRSSSSGGGHQPRFSTGGHHRSSSSGSSQPRFSTPNGRHRRSSSSGGSQPRFSTPSGRHRRSSSSGGGRQPQFPTPSGNHRRSSSSPGGFKRSTSSTRKPKPKQIKMPFRLRSKSADHRYSHRRKKRENLHSRSSSRFDSVDKREPDLWFDERRRVHFLTPMYVCF